MWYNQAMVHIGNDWDDILADVFASESYAALREFLKAEYRRYTVYPDMHDIFNALRYTPYSSVKAVILGQDPYHGEGQAHGLCFSVRPPVPAPPSLVNIFKEIEDDLGIKNTSPCLVPWAERGVLLLNTVLTVRKRPCEKGVAHLSPTPGAGVPAPLAALGVRGIFRLQTLQQDKRLLDRTWR